MGHRNNGLSCIRMGGRNKKRLFVTTANAIRELFNASVTYCPFRKPLRSHYKRPSGNLCTKQSTNASSVRNSSYRKRTLRVYWRRTWCHKNLDNCARIRVYACFHETNADTDTSRL